MTSLVAPAAAAVAVFSPGNGRAPWTARLFSGGGGGASGDAAGDADVGGHVGTRRRGEAHATPPRAGARRGLASVNEEEIQKVRGAADPLAVSGANPSET